jgi:hypothetical protein
MFCPVLEFKEEKQTFEKVEGGNMDRFAFIEPVLPNKKVLQ